MNAVSIRGDWVGRTIDGKFPLIAWLGGSGVGGTFVTEIDPSSVPTGSSASTLQRAAIKLMPASSGSDDQLAIWKASAKLSHPHLVRVLQSGRVQVEGLDLVYVVTELAEEVLAQIIPERPLTLSETRELVGPVVDALAYLHARGYVHGHVSPSNILVVDNEIKLSADRLMPAGNSPREPLLNDPHNAPETDIGEITPAADTWALGVTLVEALTQQPPEPIAATEAGVELPGSLPAPFAEIARECLQADPSRRCSLSEIRSMLDGKPRLAVVPPAAKPQAETIAPPKEKARTRIPMIPLIVGLVLLLAVIIGLQMRNHHTNTAPVQTEATQQAPPAEPESHAAPPQSQPDATTRAEVLDRVVPDVPQSARNTIQGQVRVKVRVTVDSAGTVSNAELTSRGPSAYFASMALASARKWKFKPAQKNGQPMESTWTLSYAFRRSGTDVTPVQTAP